MKQTTWAALAALLATLAVTGCGSGGGGAGLNPAPWDQPTLQVGVEPSGQIPGVPWGSTAPVQRGTRLWVRAYLHIEPVGAEVENVRVEMPLPAMTGDGNYPLRATVSGPGLVTQTGTCILTGEGAFLRPKLGSATLYEMIDQEHWAPVPPQQMSSEIQLREEVAPNGDRTAVVTIRRIVGGWERLRLVTFLINCE